MDLFFKWLGRVNAIAFLLLCIALLFVVVGLSGLFRPRHYAEPYAATAPAKPGQVRYVLGGDIGVNGSGERLTILDGTGEGIMVLKVPGKSPGKFSSEEYVADRNVNVLIVDLDTLKSRWMFTGVTRAIARSHLIRFPAVNDGPVVGLLMSVAEKDTNGDGEVTTDDDASVVLYRPGSNAVTRLLPVGLVMQVQQLSPSGVLVNYYDGKSDRLASFSVPEFKLLADQPLPAPPR